MPLRRRLFLTLPSPFYALAGISTFSSWDRRTRRMKVIVLIHSLAPTTSLAALHFPFSCELALPPFEPSLRCGVCIEQTRASTRTHLDWTACKLSCVFARWRIVSKPRQCLDIPPGPNRTKVLSLLLSSFPHSSQSPPQLVFLLLYLPVCLILTFPCRIGILMDNRGDVERVLLVA